MKTYLLFFTFMLIGGAAYWFYSAELLALFTWTSTQAGPLMNTAADIWQTVSTNPMFPIVTTGLTVATPIVVSQWYKNKEAKQKLEANQQIVQANMQGAQAIGQVETEKQALQQQLNSMKDEVTVLHAQKLDAAEFTRQLQIKQDEVNRLLTANAGLERTIKELRVQKVETYTP